MRKILCGILIFVFLISLLVGCENSSVDTSENLKTPNNSENVPMERSEEEEAELQEWLSQSPNNLNRVVPDIPLQMFKSSDTGIGAPASIWAREDDIVVSDQESHKLIVLDWDGNVLKEVGKLGMGPLEFEKPGKIFWHEKEEILYVLDIGNNRIQKLTYDLSYIDEVSLKDLDLYQPDPFQSIAVDSDGNIYISLHVAIPEKLGIYRISPDGSISKSEEMFGGVLTEKNGEIYAVQTMIHFLNEEKEYDIGFKTGQTYLYKMEATEMVKVLDFPFEYSPTDLIWVEDKVYMASSLWHLVESFKIENSKLVYLETTSPKLPFPENPKTYPYTLSYFDNTLFAACLPTGDIYIFDL